jgi:L-rhamnonate dehydratase
MPDRIDSYVRLNAKTPIPLAGAEHDYTRWGMKRFIEKRAPWNTARCLLVRCGSSEPMKIAA